MSQIIGHPKAPKTRRENGTLQTVRCSRTIGPVGLIVGSCLWALIAACASDDGQETGDGSAPEVAVSASQRFVFRAATVSLVAEASDDDRVSRVVFEADGETLSVDEEPPFSVDVALDGADNGRRRFMATAYDPQGNAASATVDVWIGVDATFLGTAPGSRADYEHLLDYFGQLTPENAGKWGSVEVTQGSRDWTELDFAADFARTNGLLFKFHTLVWGQQQPSWLADLSPSAQRTAVESWMAAVADRYGDVELIDVVNEPLNAPPGYLEALGGAGESGWDWVISAFEMARKYFPRSQLLLNDYNVLILEQFTDNYLEIVDVLQARGLIDGIGVQAHFLERADLPTVRANLDKLAATNLPIYVSELDVNFADDARHAVRFSELFSIFWNHPAVVGITHWGHLEGDIWREEAYLVRADGTARPALTWLSCFVEDAGSCSVPDYTPPPRVGDAQGLTLEAEDFDIAEGIIAVADVVAFTDEGDSLVFERVTFDDGWAELSVTYAKGNEGTGVVTIFLDDTDGPPLVTASLPSTSDWGAFDTLVVPVAPTQGEHDVIVVFSGGAGVANLDRLTFRPPLIQGANLVANGQFEANADGWFSWDGVLSTTTAYARSGTQSLLVSERSGNGPAATSLLGLVETGSTYDARVWVSIGRAASAEVNATRKFTCDGVDDFARVGLSAAATEGDWVLLSGEIAVPECELSDVLFYVEGPPGGVDLYVDDAEVRARIVGP